MSFEDEHVFEPVRPTHTLWECRRCRSQVALESADARAVVLRSVKQDATERLHECEDGHVGVMDLLGTCTSVERTPLDDGVVVNEKGKR